MWSVDAHPSGHTHGVLSHSGGFTNATGTRADTDTVTRSQITVVETEPDHLQAEIFQLNYLSLSTRHRFSYSLEEALVVCLFSSIVKEIQTSFFMDFAEFCQKVNI